MSGASAYGTGLLDRLLVALRGTGSDTAPPFALIRRLDADGHDGVDVIVATRASEHELLADVPFADGTGPRTLVLVPFRQLAERGYDHRDDGTPLIALEVDAHARLDVASVTERLPLRHLDAIATRFEPDDDGYAELVRRVQRDEIARGAGANFVIRRRLLGRLGDHDLNGALAVLRRLLHGESGAYWTFLVHLGGGRTLIGASPECHVRLDQGRATMNPISGTYRYPAEGPSVDGVLRFLDDAKETDELYMVLDEELKMMARLCPDGCRVEGPDLVEMARVAHTEYRITGSTDADPRDVLRETLLAPTVTGSPVQNAARVIARYETSGRGYYSGIVGLLGRDPDGRADLDSAIVIRTADIAADGHFDIGVGATLVRHSDADAEVAETRAKAAGLLAALTSPACGTLAASAEVRSALHERNTRISRFWLDRHRSPAGPAPTATPTPILVVDHEDTFTTMIATQLRAIGLCPEVRRHDDLPGPDLPGSGLARRDPLAQWSLVLLGPGPGDPDDLDDPRVARLHALTRARLATGQPMLAVCLSHQVLCRTLGLPVRALPSPNQGRQRQLDLFGRERRVGFYNSFAAYCGSDHIIGPTGTVEVSRDRDTGEVFALRGPRFASVQFHAESVLTTAGPDIFAELVASVLAPSIQSRTAYDRAAAAG